MHYSPRYPVRRHARPQTLPALPHCEALRPSYARTTLGIAAEWAADAEWECEEEEVLARAHFTAQAALEILNAVPEANAGCAARARSRCLTPARPDRAQPAGAATDCAPRHHGE